MRRDILDPALDTIFAKRFTNAAFLKRVAKSRRQPTVNTDQIRKQLASLTSKRERVLDTYYSGVISEGERNTKIVEIERERQVFSDLLSREEPARHIDVDTLARQFKVFAQFDMLSRDQKRRLLNTITPEIVVANYQVEGMFCSIGDSHRAMGFAAPARIYLPLGVAA